MRLVRWLLYGLATYFLFAAVWDHDWRLILASVAVWVIYPLISYEIEDVPEPRRCQGCGKGAFVPGCPVHDPEQRKAAA